jgi:site-specific recombinase XerD
MERQPHDHQLEPIDPREAFEWYLDHKKHEEDYSERTIKAHYYRLKHFIRWCEDEAHIDNLNHLTGRKIKRFSRWRRNEGNLKKVSLHTQLSTLKVFLKWAETIEAVKLGLFEFVDPPTLNKKDDVNENFIKSNHAQDILDYYEKFGYATSDHTTMAILWATGMRVGALRSIDLQDYKPDHGRIELHHRPDKGTPLKKKENGERYVSINSALSELIDDYINHHRYTVTDNHNRKPLITTRHGRPHLNTYRTTVYAATRPCFYNGGDCPGDRDPDTCDAADAVKRASGCPYNYSPHEIKKGSTTHALKNGV